MPSVQSTWSHGIGVEVETKSWDALKQGFYTTIRPSLKEYAGWIHLAIPTPVVFDGRRIKANNVVIRLSVGKSAAVTNLHVFDGDNRIAAFDYADYRGEVVHDETLAVPDQPMVKYGMSISLRAEFSAALENDFVKIVGAGVEFDS